MHLDQVQWMYLYIKNTNGASQVLCLDLQLRERPGSNECVDTFCQNSLYEQAVKGQPRSSRHISNKPPPSRATSSHPQGRTSGRGRKTDTRASSKTEAQETDAQRTDTNDSDEQRTDSQDTDGHETDEERTDSQDTDGQRTGIQDSDGQRMESQDSTHRGRPNRCWTDQTGPLTWAGDNVHRSTAQSRRPQETRTDGEQVAGQESQQSASTPAVASGRSGGPVRQRHLTHSKLARVQGTA
ncbi:uncharacterized protein LOC119966802 [Scyliorhinus canicula]|uniref:uncharacterized protein LOC119966802 n=1 Tax=Scyliorhinus canicula TaxID=7830 RepID=UPI0018F56C6C|nr:uncharacterized protein LOC119966802 [Scyliorhinus canicula]